MSILLILKHIQSTNDLKVQLTDDEALLPKLDNYDRAAVYEWSGDFTNNFGDVKQITKGLIRSYYYHHCSSLLKCDIRRYRSLIWPEIINNQVKYYMMTFSYLSYPNNAKSRMKMFLYATQENAILDNDKFEEEYSLKQLIFYPVDSGGTQLDHHKLTNIDLEKISAINIEQKEVSD
jgi:hypothetical protein